MGLIRFALALAVVFGHARAPVALLDAGIAVQAFFVISGFYMALVLDGKYASLGAFYSNRLLRLFPGYLVILAATAAVALMWDKAAFVSRNELVAIVAQPGAAIPLAAANLLILGQDILCWFDIVRADGGFVADAAFNAGGRNPPAWRFLLVPQAWSLSLELSFYALAPLLAKAGWRTLALVALASVAVRAAGPLADVSYDLWPRRLFPAELFLFVLGMLAHRVLPLARRTAPWVGWSLAAAMAALVAVHPHLPIPVELGRWLIYLSVAATLPFIFNACRDASFDRVIGDLSYPVYITHVLVIGVAADLPESVRFGAVLAGVLALSAALYVAVDRPVDAWRQRRAARQRAPRSVGQGAGAGATASP